MNIHGKLEYIMIEKNQEETNDYLKNFILCCSFPAKKQYNTNRFSIFFRYKFHSGKILHAALFVYKIITNNSIVAVYIYSTMCSSWE